MVLVEMEELLEETEEDVRHTERSVFTWVLPARWMRVCALS